MNRGLRCKREGYRDGSVTKHLHVISKQRANVSRVVCSMQTTAIYIVGIPLVQVTLALVLVYPRSGINYLL
jgi:hypothetical protein